MKKWVLKALVQKLFSTIPFGFKLNYLFQKYVTKAVVLNRDFFEDLLRHTSILLREHKHFSADSLSQKKAFELGTGWHPILPIALFLSGIKETVTIDLNDHIRKENIKTLLEWFLQYHNEGLLNGFLPDVQEEKILILKNILAEINTMPVPSILAKLRISHQIGDLNLMEIEANSFDISSSVNVLEHIHEGVLLSLMMSMNKLSKKGSFHYHSFGCYDHFYHIDKSISKFNYLQYSKKQWSIIDNNIQPQNRLRVTQIGQILYDSQFKLVKELHSEPNYKEFNKIKVHEDFINIDTAAAAVDYGTFILTK